MNTRLRKRYILSVYTFDDGSSRELLKQKCISYSGMDRLDLLKNMSPVIYRVSPKLRNSVMDYFLRRSEKQVDFEHPTIKFATLRISEKCNLRCSMCWWWGENGVGFKDTTEKSSRIYSEIGKLDFFSIIDQLAKHRTSVSIIGGEPFVRGDALEIIEYACERLPSVSVVTNGTLMKDEQLEVLSKLRNLEITFSIDGTESVHDSIRGRGMYKRTIESINRILELRTESRKPLVSTNTTITPFGIDDLGSTVSMLEELGIDIIKMQHLWFIDEATASIHIKAIRDRLGIDDNGARSHIIESPRYSDLDKLGEIISSIEHTRHKVPVLIKPRLTKGEITKYYTDLKFRKMDHCPVAWQTIRVESDGNVIFCPDEWIGGYKIGNVHSNTIEEIWTGDMANRFRTELSKGLFPGCSRCCVLNL